jgi:hypothetical protein
VKLAVILPTVDGRGDHLQRCMDTYASTLEGVRWELFIYTNRETCGHAWIEGLQDTTVKGGFTHIHYTADDLTPHPGWLTAALEATQLGYIPAPRIFNPEDDGALYGGDLSLPDHVVREWQPDWNYTDYTGVPFMPVDLALKVSMVPIHYFSDVWVSHVGRELGFETVLRHDYAFTLWWAQPRRGAGFTQNERGLIDQNLFKQAFKDRFGGPPSHSHPAGTAR